MIKICFFSIQSSECILSTLISNINETRNEKSLQCINFHDKKQ